MHEAISTGSTDDDMVATLIELGADVNRTADTGETALMEAAREAAEPLMKMLIEAAKAVVEQNSSGATWQLEEACRSRSLSSRVWADPPVDQITGETRPIALVTDNGPCFKSVRFAAYRQADGADPHPHPPLS